MKLRFFSPREIEIIHQSQIPELEKAAILADMFRVNTLYMVSKAGSGHLGSSFSCMDILTYLWLFQLNAPNHHTGKDGDIFFSSKGHDAPALYSLLTGLGRIDFKFIHRLRRLGGLPGHPDVGTPLIVTNTGSLGMGLSKARGMAISRRIRNIKGNIYIMLGDGELQEGNIWEALQPAANGNFAELIAIVDHNKLQSDTRVSLVSDLGDLESKFRSFGWETARCDGHDFQKLRNVFNHFRTVTHRPKILIADTIKGKGVPFMETTRDTQYGPLYDYHAGALSHDDRRRALTHLKKKIDARVRKAGLPAISLDEVRVEKISTGSPVKQDLVAAYGDELVQIARKDPKVLVFSADLVKDCGLLEFKKRYPQRFVECGIAEQDMVSAAGGAALRGMLPIVHSFAAFLSARPNEHIYNNAGEKTKIIYTGSLAGLLPAGPGHSHQAVRDISALSAIPGLTLIQPCNEHETRKTIRWAVEQNPESTYIRLVGIPVEPLPSSPEDYELQRGIGIPLSTGKDAICFAYGPVMLNQLFEAKKRLDKAGLEITIINMPWLNTVDIKWLERISEDHTHVFLFDDHYLMGGQGQMLAEKFVNSNLSVQVKRIGIDRIPDCGQNLEILQAHGFNADNIAGVIQTGLGA